MFNNEIELLNIRLNILDQYVDHFVIIESAETHSGIKKRLTFDIEKFPQFRNKIIYGVIEKFPEKFSAWEKENYQRNFISQFLNKADDDDFIIISDLDEIPNLENINFEKIKDKFVFFRQHQIYYKFNLKLDNFEWIGSKSCRFKNLESPQWIRDIKSKRFNWWRIDTFFSKKKYIGIRFIDNGGWHFSYLKNPKDIETKLKSYLHHIDYDLNPLGEEKIAEFIKDKKTVYNLKVDQRSNKFSTQNELKVMNSSFLPNYILTNKEKFKEWIE